MKLYEYISKFLLSYDVALFYTLDNESLGLLNWKQAYSVVHECNS